MILPATPVAVVDRLVAIRSLVSCAFMACDSLDDDDHCDALQTLLAQVSDLIRETENHVLLIRPSDVVAA